MPNLDCLELIKGNTKLEQRFLSIKDLSDLKQRNEAINLAKEALKEAHNDIEKFKSKVLPDYKPKSLQIPDNKAAIEKIKSDYQAKIDAAKAKLAEPPLEVKEEPQPEAEKIITPPPPTTPPPIIPESESGDSWTSIRKEINIKIEAVRQAYEKQGIKAWSESMRLGLEKVMEMHPGKNLYDAAYTFMQSVNLGGGYGKLEPDEALATLHHLKMQIQRKQAELANQKVTNENGENVSILQSDNTIAKNVALLQFERLSEDIANTALAAKDITTKAGRTLSYAQSEIRLNPEYGLEIRRMQLLRANHGEKLSEEDMKWTEAMWEKEKEIMKKEEEIRSQKMKDEFDNKIAELIKKYEEKLKQAGKNTPQNRAIKSKILSQKGKDIADQIRKLKIQKGDTALDVTFGLRNLAIEAVAQIVEKGSTIAEAIKEVLRDIKFKELSEDELTNHIVDGLNNKKDIGEQLEKIRDFVKENNVDDISSEMVSKNLIRDYVNAHIGEVDKKELFEKAYNILKEIIPNVSKEKLAEAYLKQGEFKQETKKQLEGGIAQQANELKKIAKAELTANQQQKIKLDLEKQKAIRKTKEYKRKLQNNEFEEPAQIKLTKQDAELVALNKQQTIIEDQYRKKQREFREKQKHIALRILETSRNIVVATMIGMPKTLAKVGTTTVVRPVFEAGRRLTFGNLFDAFFPDISKVAKRGGESSSVSNLDAAFKGYLSRMGQKKLNLLYDNAFNEYNTSIDKYNTYKYSDNPTPEKLQALKNAMNESMIKVQGTLAYKFIGGDAFKDSFEAFIHRANEIEKQFGHLTEEKFEGDFLDKTNYIIGFIGRSHSALKTFSGRFSFVSGFMARLEGAVENGEDILNASKVLQIANESYLNWEQGKYQQSNLISDLWNEILNKESANKSVLAKTLMAGGKLIAKTDVAITRVPVNMLWESAAEYAFGAFRVAGLIDKILPTNLHDEASIPRLIKQIKEELKQDGITNGERIMDGFTQGTTQKEFKAALKEKINQMDEKQAATIYKCFTKGGIGLGLYAFALVSGAIHFGIFPHKGQKKKKEEGQLAPEELNPGQWMIGDKKLGETVSALIDHTPAFWGAGMGLGLAQQYNDEIKKGKTTVEAAGEAIYTHLKIAQDNIPQTKIINPLGAAKNVVDLFKKRAKDAGIIIPSNKLTTDQLNNPDIKQFAEKDIKIPDLNIAPPEKIKIDVDEKHPNVEAIDKPPHGRLKPEEYEKYKEIKKEMVKEAFKNTLDFSFEITEKGVTQYKTAKEILSNPELLANHKGLIEGELKTQISDANRRAAYKASHPE